MSNRHSTLWRQRVIESNRLRKTTHGMTKSPEWQAWFSMLKRCRNPSDQHYPDYGGRGITVCDRWRDSFENFYADMGPRPSPDHSIDRKDNDGNYEPSNCRWATKSEQARNRRIRRDRERYHVDGEMLTTAQIAIKFGLKYHTLRYRLRNGWAISDAIAFVN